MTRAGKTKKTAVQVVKYLVIALLVCILLFPIWWMLVGSLRPYYTLISLDDVAFGRRISPLKTMSRSSRRQNTCGISPTASSCRAAPCSSRC